MFIDNLDCIDYLFYHDFFLWFGWSLDKLAKLLCIFLCFLGLSLIFFDLPRFVLNVILWYFLSRFFFLILFTLLLIIIIINFLLDHFLNTFYDFLFNDNNSSRWQKVLLNFGILTWKHFVSNKWELITSFLLCFGTNYSYELGQLDESLISHTISL